MSKRSQTSLITLKGHVLLALYRNPEVTYREIAQMLGITERYVAQLVWSLYGEGYINIERMKDEGFRHRTRCTVADEHKWFLSYLDVARAEEDAAMIRQEVPI